MTRHLHIICAAVPWPPDNSMAIDIFYKMQALHKAGIKIHLHYSCTNPNCHPTELNKYCESVHPYPCGKQKTSPAGINSRPGGAGNDSIANAVSNDNYPVLFEGINCTGTLQQIAAADRNVVVRLYNDECRYYDHLKKSTGLFFQKIRLNHCAREMKKCEEALPQENCLYAFSTPGNANSFRDDHPSMNVHFLPLFTRFHTVKSKTGVGSFCLYHGDLSDPCNEKAAIWLLSKVFNDINIPLVIAGKEPGKQIHKLAQFYSHTCLIVDPSPGEMDDLVDKAHINVLPSFSYKQPEQKLVHALYTGRHCIVNPQAVGGTQLESACHIGKNAEAFKSIILQLYHRPFEEEEIELRKKVFSGLNEEEPLAQLVKWLYD